MKKTAFAFALVAGLCFASCGESSNGGGAPTPTPDNKDPKNIQEVEQLLRSAGHVSEAVEDKLITKVVGSPTSVPALRHALESTGLIVDCDKVTQPMQYDVTAQSGDFALLEPSPTILWPGCFIQGKSIRGKGDLTAIPYIAKRQSGRISLQVSSGAKSVETAGEGLWYEEVQEMRESEVNQAQTKLIRHWQESGAPASTSFSMQIVHSPEEAMIASGLDLEKSGGKFKTFLSSGFDKKKAHVLVKLYHRFYTLGYEDPEGGGKGAFKSTIEQGDLAPYTGAGNPICYISSVSYGRAYYFLFESGRSSNALLNALSTSFGKFQAGLSIERNEVFSGSQVRMLELGSSANGGQGTTISPEKVFTLLRESVQPSSKNLGTPISFTIKHLYDAQPVRMSNSLSYVHDKVTFVPRSKSNNVAILLRDVAIESSTKGQWVQSNKGHVKMLDASVSFDKTGDKGVHYKQYIQSNTGVDLTSRTNLRSTAYLPVYGHTYYNCRPEGIDLITLSIDLEIRPEAYNRNGGRVGQSPQRVTLKRTFRYDESNRKWKPLGDGANMGGDAYRTLTTTHTFEGLTFNIRANFSFFVDNTLIE